MAFVSLNSGSKSMEKNRKEGEVRREENGRGWEKERMKAAGTEIHLLLISLTFNLCLILTFIRVNRADL